MINLWLKVADAFDELLGFIDAWERRPNFKRNSFKTTLEAAESQMVIGRSTPIRLVSTTVSSHLLFPRRAAFTDNLCTLQA